MMAERYFDEEFTRSLRFVIQKVQRAMVAREEYRRALRWPGWMPGSRKRRAMAVLQVEEAETLVDEAIYQHGAHVRDAIRLSHTP